MNGKTALFMLLLCVCPLIYTQQSLSTSVVHQQSLQTFGRCASSALRIALQAQLCASCAFDTVRQLSKFGHLRLARQVKCSWPIMQTKIINAAEQMLSLIEDYDYYEALNMVAHDEGLEQDEAQMVDSIVREELGW